MMLEKEKMKYLTLVIHRDMALVRRRVSKVKNIISSKLFSREGIILMAVVFPLIIKKSNRIRRVILGEMFKLRENIIKLVMSVLAFQLKAHLLKIDKGDFKR
jgi:hypothetical protein